MLRDLLEVIDDRFPDAFLRQRQVERCGRARCGRWGHGASTIEGRDEVDSEIPNAVRETAKFLRRRLQLRHQSDSPRRVSGRQRSAQPPQVAHITWSCWRNSNSNPARRWPGPRPAAGQHHRYPPIGARRRPAESSALLPTGVSSRQPRPAGVSSENAPRWRRHGWVSSLSHTLCAAVAVQLLPDLAGRGLKSLARRLWSPVTSACSWDDELT